MSDATDQSESKRKHIMEYNAILGDIELEHNEYQTNYLEKQKDKILRLAKILDESGHPKENICAKVCKDVAKYDIKDRYVRQVLPDEYKDVKKKSIEQSNRTISGSSAASENRQEEPISVTNDGKHHQEIDSIYGKTHEQMRQEADEEIRVDKEETLEGNPSNMLRETPNPAKESILGKVMISDSSPELRDLSARITELEEALRIQKEEADTKGKKYEQLRKEYVQNKPENLQRQIEEYKQTIRNLQTIQSNYDDQAVKEELGYKEIEIFKLNTLRVSWLLQTSKTSERTLFLLVNPKSMEIVEVKTDKEMHRIQSRRRQEAELLLQEQQKQQQEVRVK